jgi:hypothetical protein
MWLIGVLIITSGLAQADLEQHWVRCLMIICTDHFPSGDTVAVFLPSDENYSRMTHIGHHLLKNIHQADRWPLIVYRDTDKDTAEAVNDKDECTGYIVFVSCYNNIYEITTKINAIFARLDFRHTKMPSWSMRSRFVIAVENDCNTINPRELSQKILSTLWFYKLINVVVVIQEEGSTESQLTVSTSVSGGRSPPLALGLYTWFPYQSPKRCTQVEDVVLLDKWVMEGKGFLVQNSNVFPQKIGKTFNGCPLRGVAKYFPHMVEYEQPTSRDTGSSTPVIKDGWEVRLFRVITNSLNMTQTYVPAPQSFVISNLDGLINSLKRDEADILFGGLESRGRWLWEDYLDTTSSYFTRRIRWYVPCAFKYARWSSIYRIFSPQLWLCLILSLAVTSSTISLVARHEGTYSTSPEYWAVTKSLTCTWAVILGVGAPALPHKASLRAVFLAWLFFSLAINTLFQTSLTTFLTESGYELPIKDIDQMLASKIKYGYHPIFDNVYNESDDAYSPIILRNRVLCQNMSTCLKWALDYKNISIILDEVDIEEKYSSSSVMYENSKPLICPLDDGNVVIINNAMMMRVGDPLLERINEVIQRVVEAGLFMQWKNSHFDELKMRSGTLRSYSLLDDYYNFTLEHMHPAFYLLLMGFCISTLILLLELAHNRIFT